MRGWLPVYLLKLRMSRMGLTFAKGEFFMSTPERDGRRHRLYYTDRIAKRLGIDHRLINPDTGRPRAKPPMCECGHAVNRHRDDEHWTCRKCPCKSYSGDDV